MSKRIDHVLLTNHLSDLEDRNRSRQTNSILNKKMISNSFIRYTTEPPESIQFEAIKSSSYRQKLYYKRFTNTLDGGDQKLNISPHINLDIVWSFINKLEYQSTLRVATNIKLGVKG
jgi:hypothetical protein